jgi:hypothetical protein
MTTIKVGDKIITRGLLGIRSVRVVHRVTKTKAFIRVNDLAEQAFRIEVSPFGPTPIPRAKWRTTFYEHLPARPDIAPIVREIAP